MVAGPIARDAGIDHGHSVSLASIAPSVCRFLETASVAVLLYAVDRQARAQSAPQVRIIIPV